MTRNIFLLMGTLCHLFFQALADPVLGTSYSSQQGTRSSGTTIVNFDSGDFVTYSDIDFGNPGTTKGILMNYAHGRNGGVVEIRLGGPTGDIIAEWSPARTGRRYSNFITAYVGINDVDGVHDLTLVGRDAGGIMDFAWFELSDFAERAAPLSRIEAYKYSNQKDIRLGEDGHLINYDNGDFITYSHINFGMPGTTKGIIMKYAKGRNAGVVEIRLGGPTGTIIGEFAPAKIGSNYGTFLTAYIGIDEVDGIHDLTFVGRDSGGIMDMEWFELSDFAERAEEFPRIEAYKYSTQKNVAFGTNGNMGWFDSGDYITYSQINFGTFGTTKSLDLKYARDRGGGSVELRIGGPTGDVIAEFETPRTGSWDNYQVLSISLDGVEGIHDLTFMGKGTHGLMNMEWFELKEDTIFDVATDYKIDDENGIDIQCTYSVVKDAYIEQVYNKYYLNSGVDADTMFFDQLGATDSSDAEMLVTYLCESAQDEMALDAVPFDQIVSDEGGDQFVELFYTGHATWNEETETLLEPSDGETPANYLKYDASQIPGYKSLSEKKVFQMPDLPQFDPSVCASHAAQCCWPRDRQANDNNGNCNTPYDSDCVDKDVADNTDLCYNELDKAPYASNINATGFSVYGDEGPIHCHGFAWSPDQLETTTRYKANALFFVSMFDHMYQRGYVENIPGSPMCGCVEHMPVVTRADCTQTNVKEFYTFKIINGHFSSSLDRVHLRYQACQGANNHNNDLRAFVQQLVNDGKLTEVEQDIVNSRLVGHGNCPSSIDNLIDSKGFEKGYEINEDKWTFIVGEGFDDQKPILDYHLVHEMMENQGDVQIIRRVCPSCRSSHRDIYYRRLTPIPEGFNLLDTLMNNWFDTDNQHNVDFALYSTHLDAYLDTNRWTFCNFNDPGIGFPRDCGPTGRVNFQWNSYWRNNGGDANYHAFLIPTDPLFESQIERPTLATFLGSDYAPLWKGVKTSGTTVISFDKGDYFTYPSVNFGDPGTTKAILLNYARGNQGGSVQLRLDGPEGDVIAEFSPARTGGWDRYQTAAIGIDDVDGIHDLTFTAEGTHGLMNLAWLELSDLAERAQPLARIDSDEYSDQSGVEFGRNHERSWMGGVDDEGDFVTYTQVNFGASGTTKGIIFNYARGHDGGKIEIRLGGPTGDIIGEFTPARTGDWFRYRTAFVGIDDVDGVHDLTFVGKGTWGLWNLDWFELTDFAERAAPLSRIEAYKYSNQKDIRLGSNGQLIDYDNGDFITYSNINFGTPGTTKGIIMKYSHGRDGGVVEIRLGGPTGTIIGEFTPAKIGSNYGTFLTAYIGIDEVDGIHDLTFVGRDAEGIMDMEWFELSDFAERAVVHPRIEAYKYSTQKYVRFGTNGNMGWFDSGDYITYSQINFGASGTTTSITLNYARDRSGGSVELRLGGPTGDVIAEFETPRTGSWGNYQLLTTSIDGVEGVHDLTIVGKSGSALMNMEWFELN